MVVLVGRAHASLSNVMFVKVLTGFILIFILASLGLVCVCVDGCRCVEENRKGEER